MTVVVIVMIVTITITITVGGRLARRLGGHGVLMPGIGF